MGAITTEFRASSNITTTALQALATSSTRLVGWTSNVIDNSVNKDLDILVSARFTRVAAASQTGVIEVWAYTQLDDTLSGWAINLSAGTAATEGAATIIDDEQKASELTLLWSCATDNSASAEVYNMPMTSVASAFRFMPNRFALFITTNATSSGAAFSAAQVTTKGTFENAV